MTKRYDEPIEVVPDPVDRAAPVAFSWRGKRYDIDERLSTWLEAGEWWNGSAMRDREYHRVLARPSGTLASGDVGPDGSLLQVNAVFDVYRDRIRDDWRIARIWD